MCNRNITTVAKANIYSIWLSKLNIWLSKTCEARCYAPCSALSVLGIHFSTEVCFSHITRHQKNNVFQANTVGPKETVDLGPQTSWFFILGLQLCICIHVCVCTWYACSVVQVCECSGMCNITHTQSQNMWCLSFSPHGIALRQSLREPEDHCFG